MNFDWSLSLGRWFGVTVRLHLLFLLVVLMRVFDLDAIKGGYYGWSLLVLVLLFFIVLLHEYGHCYAGRRVGGTAEQILLWPLGGLAFVSVPHDPRASFITTAGGPLVNVGILLLSLPYMFWGGGKWGSYLIGLGQLHDRDILNTFFAINLDLLLFNLIPAFPMDNGRILRAILWPRFGYRRATIYTIRVAQVCIAFLLLWGLYVFTNGGGFLLLALSLYLGFCCLQEKNRVLEEFDEWEPGAPLWRAGADGRDWVPRNSWFGGFVERRKRARREREARSHIELQLEVDRILAKVTREGLPSLSTRERRFLKSASKRMRR